MENPPPEPDDEALARRAAAGDESAFEALVARFQGRIYRLVRRMTGSDGEAEDALQDAFLSAYRSLATFRGEAKFSTWLYRIATNAALMRNRARARRPVESLEAYAPSFDAAGRHAREPADLSLAARADELLDRRRLMEQALEGIDRLPEACRAAFVLRDLEEMPTAEVAIVLGIDAAAVRQRVHRARLLLRGFLSHLVGVEP
ncbi:MAG TPA: sigma-70 family RNA polymerase sigma factor [Dongiaceae bacterium]|nr:sigma-70 family RNA polymerase sigma factor [Dongiaceae bacterium]